MPTLMPENVERTLPADVIRHARPIVVIGARLDLAEDIRLLARECLSELLPLPAIGEEIDRAFGFCFNRFG